LRVLDQLQQHAESRPDAIAFADADSRDAGTQRLTYAQLAAAVVCAADAIDRATPSDSVILIQLPNALAYPVAYLGVLAAGRTVFPLHPALTAREVSDAARKTGARWIVSDHEVGDGLTRVSSDTVTSWIDEADATRSRTALSERHAGRMLLQSSGTTGMPKIVERSSASIDAVAQNVATSARLAPDDQVIAAIPMCHSYGIENAVAGPLWAGASVRVCAGFDPQAVADCWARAKRCVFPAVPVMIDLLASRAGLPAPRDLKAVYSAGATMPAAVEATFAKRFGVRVGQLYGATEIGSVTFGRPWTDALPEGCVGHAMPGVSIRVLDLDRPADHPPLGPGQQGHVAIDAPSMLSRYLGDEAMPIVNGHFLTGDLGVLDESGALRITGRVKTLIEVGGMKVNPLEVEHTLNRHPGVAECVVVASLVSQTLSRMTVYFVPADASDPPSAAELRRFAKESLAPYKVPRVFKAIDQLPRSSLGKVRRASLAGAGHG